MVFINDVFIGPIDKFESYNGFGEIDGDWVNYRDHKNMICGINYTHYSTYRSETISMVCPD